MARNPGETDGRSRNEIEEVTDGDSLNGIDDETNWNTDGAFVTEVHRKVKFWQV